MVKSDYKVTYLIIEESSGKPNEISLDGELWPFKIGEEVSSGEHILKCGGNLKIMIKEGTVYYFNYWVL